jgi:predicted AAA+ superfamily ATPase
MERYLTEQVRQDLKEKMVFITGPRQVGKTTLARHILGKHDGYLNWDIPADRARITGHDFPRTPLVVLDEIHKFRLWRNTLKGLFDERKGRQKILVTGSAKLGYYRYGGDSLQGRYHLLRMYPLSVAELDIHRQGDLSNLLRLGGFPEPFFRGTATSANRWSQQYRHRLITEDITGLEAVHDVASMELLLSRLPDLVGSPLSINALREDLRVNHGTLTRWLEIYERTYAIFRIAPFGAPRIRAVKKEQKHYHFDWNLIKKEGPRIENFLAVHLLKWMHFEMDTKGRELELRYFRDVDGREVDFVVTEHFKPILFMEAKWNDQEIDRSLHYLKSKFPDVESWQLSATGRKDYISRDGIHVSPALIFLKTLV